jgi:hypothetical protein
MWSGLDDMREGVLITLFLGVQVPFVVREAAFDVYIFSRRVLCLQNYE